MIVFGRKRRLPEGLRGPHDSFCLALAPVESAKEALTRAVPMARYPGAPLGEALFRFDEELARAEPLMPAWRADAVAGEWDACREGIGEARRRATRLRDEAPDLGFESLLEAIQRLLDPLEPFALAAERFRELGA